MPGLAGIDQILLNEFIPLLSGYRLFFYLVTQLGSPLTLTLSGALAFFVGKNRLRAFGAVLLVGMLLAIPVIDDVKYIVKRPRPESAINYALVTNNSYSFPSGHALASFLAATLLGAFLGRRFYIVGYVLAIAVSLSRLYLGVHYPTDIAAGAILGIAIGALLVYAAHRFGLSGTPSRPGKDRTTTFDAFPVVVAVVTVILYYLHDPPAMLFFMALAALLILYLMLRDGGYDLKAITIFILSAVALIAAYALLYLEAYGLSLLVLAVAYVTIAYAGKTLEKKAT